MNKLIFPLFLLFLFTRLLPAQNFIEVTSMPFDSVFAGSIAFSDVDGDGDQDVLITGFTDLVPIARLYANDGTGVFTEVSAPIEGVEQSSTAFSDVDSDGDQDLLITGLISSFERIAKLYTNNGMGTFTEVMGTTFDGVEAGSIAFSDVDGDGDQDVLITGFSDLESIAKLYTNDGTGTFSEVTGTPFEGVDRGSIAFSDVDGDGDDDLLITGFSNSTSVGIAKLYTNDGTGAFTEVTSAPFEGVDRSSIAFSDVDGDGDQDVLITGVNSSFERIAKLYTNDGMGAFTEATGTPFDDVWQGSIAFSDVDGDGDQDVLITGFGDLGPTAKLYSNDGTGAFTEVTGTPFEGVGYSSIAFSDVDGDGHEDVLITGFKTHFERIAKLYTNLGPSSTTDIQQTTLTVYPNPTTGLLALDQLMAAQVSVFDLMGSRLADFDRPGDRIDISDLPAGVYVLRILGEDARRYAARVIKE